MTDNLQNGKLASSKPGTTAPPVALEPVGAALVCVAATAPSAPSVATSMRFAASASRVWDRLMFYEQIDQRPPLHLRLLLPVPIETVGRKSQVGDEARCVYEGGYLIKRVTHVDPGVRYVFEVVEQALAIGGGMKLSGGEYTIAERAGGFSEVQIVTRYDSAKRPRWLWQPIERAVCHSFHRHILRAIRRAAEARA